MTIEQTPQYDDATIAVQSGLNTDTQYQSVVAPIYMATNFKFDDYHNKPEFDYSRGGNPTRDLLATALTELEHGAGTTVTSSGMAAVNLVLQLLTPNDVLVAPKDCYGGTHRLFESLAKKNAFKLLWLDFYSDDIQQELIKVNPSLIWLETPSNPLLRLTDIKKICEVAKTIDAKVAVDNTFLSPVGQSPIKLGADIVVHSSTKYLNGHSDVVSGAVVCADKQLADDIAWWANNTGVTGSPFDSYLILRGIRTLSVRVKQHSQNALAIAEVLQAHEAVQAVHYPGLRDHPEHLLAQTQQACNGGMLSFELAGSEQQVAAFLAELKLFTLAESLGGTESLICHPAAMTHASMPEEAQLAAGISRQLLRLSVGIEEKTDLIADLLQALSKVNGPAALQSTPVNNTKLELIDKEQSASCRLSPALAALW